MRLSIKEIQVKEGRRSLDTCHVGELADFSTSNTALRFARVILEKYNGQRGGRKLPYRFRG